MVLTGTPAAFADCCKLRVAVRHARPLRSVCRRVVAEQQTREVQPAAYVPLLRCVGLAAACSVRSARRLVASGRVVVDGARATDEELVVHASSRVAVQQLRRGKLEELVAPARQEYYLKLYKPRGVVCSHEKQTDSPIISSWYPVGVDDCHNVGRLDRKSEGLLFLTTDGFFTRSVTMPETHVEKEYLALTTCPDGQAPSQATLRRLREGVTLEDGSEAKAERAEVVAACEGGAPCLARLKIVVTEGRYHLVRRLLRGVGHDCLQLIRTRIGGVTGMANRPLTLREAAQENVSEPTPHVPESGSAATLGDATALAPGEVAPLEAADIMAIYRKGLRFLDVHHPLK
eukprot:TRINITY_DN48347_c1_g1_i1.p1 TRINITY_DN48347_c1_g1~~TRINITY_DN48347_c1_g1_i1.p1  ORF type:complete len:345 (+),score=64.71 TRINITY_DN48347_c1_g1_i1:45-1079(+)